MESEAVLREIGEAVTPLLERDFARIDRYHPHTHGEVLYVEQGCRGIRGEAMDGFPAVARIALPALRRFRQEGRPDNEAYIQTLLLLLSQVEDTNILPVRCRHPPAGPGRRPGRIGPGRCLHPGRDPGGVGSERKLRGEEHQPRRLCRSADPGHLPGEDGGAGSS